MQWPACFPSCEIAGVEQVKTAQPQNPPRLLAKSVAGTRARGELPEVSTNVGGCGCGDLRRCRHVSKQWSCKRHHRLVLQSRPSQHDAGSSVVVRHKRLCTRVRTSALTFLESELFPLCFSLLREVMTEMGKLS
jgi:hypothetical protein